jgi:hypothetical protein
MVQKGELKKLASGIYLLAGFVEDEFYTAGLRFGCAVFSRRTALYLNGLTNRQLEGIEMNFPSNYNTTGIEKIKCYRVMGRTFEVGIGEAETPSGNIVKCYDKERCICDLFYYDDSDTEEKTFAIKAYKKSGADFDKLFDYAEKLGVLVQIKSIFEVLS